MEFDYLGQNTRGNINMIIRSELAHCNLKVKHIDWINFENGWKFVMKVDQTQDSLYVIYDKNTFSSMNLYNHIGVYYCYSDYKKENEKYYDKLRENNTIQKIKDNILEYLSNSAWNSELAQIINKEMLENLRLLCNNIYVIYEKDNSYTLQLMKDYYTIFASIYLRVKNNGKYTLKWTIEEQNNLTNIIQTQQENTTLVSCIVLLKTLLERKGLKYSENS
ncbi:hypothetical protein FNU3_64 [Fusobacterium phage vB_FnuS_FNU3]|uniref:TetR family transcriptional regulator n=1 Tax=Fusobacterium phage Fnu1 TaxID=2530024 RepID=A0A481W5R9_9CAUD|nr:TetR family transcriptional regulator [Fusobacterium phage Fnu1]QBJ04108.1 TetR family transcriptional regulator [Fusobacterium phage Fnu1]WGH50235.1 putative transcriptional regulator, TetR family [Fusobacterium phage vB_FnuS_FNU2]WGH50379.1 hypothetical protein FNU3_64 [Fusobacterium phage vB_FnuS_FNU3]